MLTYPGVIYHGHHFRDERWPVEGVDNLQRLGEIQGIFGFATDILLPLASGDYLPVGPNRHVKFKLGRFHNPTSWSAVGLMMQLPSATYHFPLEIDKYSEIFTRVPRIQKAVITQLIRWQESIPGYGTMDHLL